MAVVLVVEDEPHVLFLALLILRKLGHETIFARTLAEAQGIIHSDQKFDLVFTDLKLANYPQGGFTVGQLVQEHRLGIPVLFTSGQFDVRETNVLFSEPNSFLRKPYTAQALSLAIANLLQAKL
jgi:DNA-binding NtrC family response regulator